MGGRIDAYIDIGQSIFPLNSKTTASNITSPYTASLYSYLAFLYLVKDTPVYAANHVQVVYVCQPPKRLTQDNSFNHFVAIL